MTDWENAEGAEGGDVVGFLPQRMRGQGFISLIAIYLGKQIIIRWFTWRRRKK